MSISYSIYTRINRLEGIAFVGIDFGQIAYIAGERTTGISIVERSRDAFAKLGMPARAEQAEQLLAEMSAG